MSVAPAFSKGLPSPKTVKSWGLDQMAGRLVEISGQKAAANLTVAFGLVLEAQKRGEPVAWVTLQRSTFYPPDVADSGISLEHLAVVRVPDTRAAARAAVELTRSGGFALVIVDLGPEVLRDERTRKKRTSRRLSTPLLTKLVGLARKNTTAVVVLTEKTEHTSSVSSLISLRAEARRSPDAPGELEVAILKDKKRGPGRLHHEVCRAPAGLS